MTDDLESLRGNVPLTQLLTHYSPANPDDRDAWHDRLMASEGLESRELSRLHGTLLASAWIEQNTGYTPQVAEGHVRACYRLTMAGRRALRRLSEPDDEA